MRPDQIALQLYTVRRLLADDLPGTLRAVADAGYEAVEVAGVQPAAQERLGDSLAAAGLRPIAAHVGLDRLRGDPDGTADWLESLRCTRLVVPSLPDDERATAAGVRALAGELSGHAVRLGARGIRLGYHNHASEFGALEASTAWDILLAELSPDVEIELDVYWASVGGRDPAEEIRRAADRVRLLHMKDRARSADPRDAPAGQGILDMPAIVRAGRTAGVEWYVVEQDEPADPLADIAAARDYLSSLAGAASARG